ncbi:MAG: hypothetical protein V5A27_04165 [Halapricum sp.]
MAIEESVSATQADARKMAKQLGLGFKYHDQRKRQKAIEAFAAVDIQQFQHVSEETARKAAIAYVDALWAKDEVEQSCMVDGEMDTDALDDADWSAVRSAFARRADLVDMDPRYGEQSTIGWRRHKTGGDYWTPLKRAQTYEIQAAIQNPDYPSKPRYGQSGFGPEATRYELGVELHDTRQFKAGVEAMTPYFKFILDDHNGQSDYLTEENPSFD